MPTVGGPDLAASAPLPAHYLRGGALMLAVLIFLCAVVFAALLYKRIHTSPRKIDTIEIRGTTEFKGQVASALILLKTKFLLSGC